MKHPGTTVNAAGSNGAAPWPTVLALLLLTIHAALAIDAMRRESVTVDEVAHLPAGISYWQQGKFELYHHNPPLIKLLAALPALATRPNVDYSQSWQTNHQRGIPVSQWAFGWEFMYANAARYDDIYFWARLTIVGLSCLTGWVIYLWARELFGPMAGLVGLVLWTCCPNALAHAGLVTTDMGATCGGFVATYFFWRYLRAPSWARAGMAGTALGLAQLTKFSLLLLYALWLILWVVRLFVPKPPSVAESPIKDRPRVGDSAGGRGGDRAARASTKGSLFSLGNASGPWQFVAMYAWSVLVINLGYLFEGTGTPLGEFTFLSRSFTRPRLASEPPPAYAVNHPWGTLLARRINRFAGTALAKLPVPLPREYVAGFDEQKLESEGIEGQGYPVYLCGELRRTGWWWYYFFALAVKVPLGTWWLSALALGTGPLTSRARAPGVDELVLLAPPATVLLVMSFLTDINLGLRYVLPAFPFWFVLVSRTALLVDGPRWRPALVLVPVLWNCMACVRSHPHHLAYFNELVGGRDQGHRYLLDSNLDWGQDLLKLSTWLDRNAPGEPVGLAYFGNLDPSILREEARGFDFHLAPPARFDDLVPVDLSRDHELRADIAQWFETHGAEASAWVAQHRRELWYMPAFQELIATRLEMDEGPRPGLFAISANLLHGLPFRLRDHHGNIWNFASGPSSDADPYEYFREVRPEHRVALIGGSIFVFRLSLDEANRLRLQLGLEPIGPDTSEPPEASTRNPRAARR